MPARLEQRPARFERVRNGRVQIENFLLERDLAAGDPADVEEIVDDPAEMPDLTFDHRAQLRLIGRRAAFHQPERIDDGGERIAQFVREHGQELVHLPLALLQRFESPARGQITRDLGEPLQGAVPAAQRRDDDVRGKSAAVLAHPPAFVFDAALAARDHELVLGPLPRHVLCGVEPREVAADRLARGVAVDRLRGGVPRRDLARPVQHDDRVILDAVHDETEPLLALAKDLRLSLVLGELGAQRLVGNFELQGSLLDRELQSVVTGAQCFHRALALADHRAQDEAGDDERARVGEQKQQRRVGRSECKHALAVQGMPDCDRADDRGRGGHLAPAEAQRDPDHEREGKKGERNPFARGRRGAEDEHGRQRQRRRRDRRFDGLRQRPPWSFAQCPRDDERRDDEHARGIALPPRPGIEGEVGPWHRARQSQRNHADRSCDQRAERAQDHEPDHVLDAAEIAGALERALDPGRRRDCLQGVAGGDQDGSQRRPLDRQIGQCGTQPYPGPDPDAEEQDRGERDAGGRPHGRGIARRDRQQERQLGRHEVGGGEQDSPARLRADARRRSASGHAISAARSSPGAPRLAARARTGSKAGVPTRRVAGLRLAHMRGIQIVGIDRGCGRLSGSPRLSRRARARRGHQHDNGDDRNERGQPIRRQAPPVHDFLRLQAGPIPRGASTAPIA